MAAAQVPTTGLQGLYKFENTLADSSGNGNHLTATNNPTAVGYVAGRNNVGEALFTGANNLCGNLMSPSTMNFTGNATTISFWAKFDGPSGGMRSLVTVLNGSSLGATYSVEYINHNGANYINFYAYHNTAYTSYTVMTIYLQNFMADWHHYTFTFDAAKAKCYVDGTSQVEVNSVNSVVTSGSNAVRLSHASNSYCFKYGWLDEMAIYNRALNATEVRDLFYGLYEGPCFDVVTATIPNNIALCPTSNLVIPITINNVYNPTFQWFKNGQPIANSNNDTLNLPVSATNDGSYTVRITTYCDTVIVGPTVVATVNSSFAPVLTNNAGQLSVSPANGTGYNWYFNGVMYASNSTMSSITPTNPGTYAVEIVYTANGTSCTSGMSNSVVFCPSGFEVVANGFSSGTTATYCEDPNAGYAIYSSTSGFPQRNYQWYKNGVAIPNANNSYYSGTNLLSAAGIYTYRVTSTCDTAFSGNFEIFVLPRPTVSVSASGNILTASTAGTNFDWYFNGNYISGNTQSITAVGNGIYTVFVTDAAGCVSAESAPYIYTASVSTCADSISGNSVISIPYTGCETGASASFNSSLTGNGITYQWFKDGNAISGANAAFYATTLNAINNGVYTMRAYTSCDTVTFGGTFTINLTAGPSQPTVTVTDSIITADQTAAEYIWQLNGGTLPETTQSITMTTTGYYTVIVGDGTCQSVSSAAHFYVPGSNNCGFTTTYTVGAGECPELTFTLDGATLPVTAYVRYTGQAGPIAHTFTNDVNVLDDFCPSTYEIMLVDDAGCVDSLNFTITNVGIAQMPTTINISLYPNPVQQTLTLSTTETLTGVEVYNVMGQRVVSIAGNATQIDVTTLPAGTYYLNAISAKGSVRKPFVKL